ncbi:hypothetical protein BH11PSE13_BH11PSE13_13390 [soil metagenome]
MDWPWDRLPSDMARSLAISLREQFIDGPVYLLVDPLLSALDALPSHLARYVIPGDGLGIATEETPFLVQFENRDDPWLEESLRWAVTEHLKACFAGSGAYRVAGWLQPHEEGAAEDLARRLGALIKTSRASSRGRYLRLADRRVLALLHSATRTPDALTTPAIDWSLQLQGIATWSYMDHNLALQSLRGRQGTMVNEPLRLDAAHWDLLAQAEAVNRGLMAWQCTTHPLPDDALKRLIPALARARQHGLQLPEDQAAYAAEAMRHPAFEQWPDLRGRIERSLKTQQPLEDRLEALRGQWINAPAVTSPHPFDL